MGSVAEHEIKVAEYGEGQTDTQTRVTNIHFASSTTHAKGNKLRVGLGVSIIRPHRRCVLLLQTE